MLAQAKQLALAMLSEAAAAYGEQLKDEQEVLAKIADVVIDVYAIESALARADKLGRGRAKELAAVAVDSCQVFVSDAADRCLQAGRHVGRALATRGRAGVLNDRVAPFANFAGVDTIAARRRIADAVIAAGKHPF